MLNSKFADVPTQKKVVLGASAPMLLMVIIGAVALVSLFSINRTSAWVQHTHSVLGTASEIVAGAVDMETGMRGYLLAGREEFLEPYNRGEEVTYRLLAELQQTVDDNPPQVALLQEVESVLRDWQANVTTMQIDLRREIGDAATMNDMAALVGQARGKTYFDKFRGQIATFIEREEALLVERQASFDAALRAGTVSAAETRHAMNWVVHTYNVIGEANRLLASAIDMETGMRGYLLAGKIEFLEPFDGGKARFDQILTDLSQTVDDNPAQVELLSEINATIQEWLTDVVQPTIDLRTKIGDAKTMDDMADLIAEARGKQYFDRFRDLMGEFAAKEEALLVEREASSHTTTMMSYALISMTLILGIVAGVFIARKIGTSIARPIQSITRAMQTIVDGDNSVEIEGQKRKDEVGDIARATQVFKENAEEVERLAKADAENAQKLKEATEAQMKEAEERANEERKAKALADQRQAMMSNLQKAIGDVVSGATKGDFTRSIDDAFDDEDLEHLKQEINRLMSTVRTGLDHTVETLSDFAAGDLSVRMNGDFEGAFLDLQENLNATIERLSGLVAEIASVSAAVNTASEEMARGASQLSQGTGEQARSTEETAASMNEMSTSVSSSAQNSQEARRVSVGAAEKAERGSKIVGEAIDAMSEIEASSGKVGAIVALIENIAFQTNLLSLNASVEAARAGAAGKGFAVVAAEVRDLAGRTTDASNEINELIKASSSRIQSGVDLIDKTGASLNEIMEAIKNVDNYVQDISNASQEQAAGVAEVTNTLMGIEKRTQTNAEIAERGEQNAADLKKSAHQLSELLSFFSRPEWNEQSADHLADEKLAS